MIRYRGLFGAALTCVLLSTTALQPASADTGGDEVAMVHEMNRMRSQLGLPALAIKGELFDVARAWSRRQAATGAIAHNPVLGKQLPRTWLRMAENVGAGPHTWALFQALVASPSHVVHMLDARFDSVGVGIVEAGDTFYATMVFMTTGAPAQAKPRIPPCRRVRNGRCILR